jgi:uncharacterized protein (TIGR03118 family)
MDIMRAFVTRGFPWLLVLISTVAQADIFFQQTNLVSSVPGLAAFTDPNLKNPWGISHSATSPNWVSNQFTGTTTLYDGDGQLVPLVVTIPALGLPSGPTGQVFNPTNDFVLFTGGKAVFLFANLDGSISAWNGSHGTLAEIVASTAGAEYTGLALGNNGTGNFLYAANDEGATIDVFDTTFTSTALPGSFTDPTLPAGFAPYNIQNINGTLYVTYENETSGGGVINRFDLNGNFLGRLTSNPDGGPLDSPWGLALAPAGFGPFGGALLVGNEDDGHINAFDPITGALLGTLLDATHTPIANPGLWGLIFGNGGNGGDPNTLFFAAGIENEREGLFGAIRAASVPEPASSLLFLSGALAIMATRRRRLRDGTAVANAGVG